MKLEKITVVVPTYNNAPWLVRSLDSLLAQTYPNLEIIVVNDGSTDDTKAVLDAYTAQHPSVKVIHKENGGVTSARLRGVAEASGEWIGFMDGDDIIEPQMYARLMENACAYDADISHCGHQVHFLDGRIEYVHKTDEIRLQERKKGLQDLLENEVEGSLCLKLYRRALFAGLEAWMDLSVKNNEDLLMNYYLFSRAKKSVFEGVCPYHYMLRKGSASYNGITEHGIFDPIRVRSLLLEDCDQDMKEDVRHALMRNLLFAYAQLAVAPDWKQYGEFRQQVRSQLQAERKNFYLLSVRNRILAEMICRAPWSFHVAYRIFVALFQREEQH